MATKKRTKKPMDTKLVDDYVARLEAALGDDIRFGMVVAELQANPRVDQPTLALVCKLFYGDANTKTSKAEAIRRIRSRHESLMDFKAKSAAQAGRSAA